MLHRPASDRHEHSGSGRPTVRRGWADLVQSSLPRDPAGDLYRGIAFGSACVVALALYALLARTGAQGLALGWAPALAAGLLAGALWPLTLGVALWAAVLWTLTGFGGA